jgi:hypothetical protein
MYYFFDKVLPISMLTLFLIGKILDIKYFREFSSVYFLLLIIFFIIKFALESIKFIHKKNK